MVSATTAASASSSWFTPRRLRFSFIVSGAMWIAWTLSVALGPGNFDLAGQTVGTDFTQFYSAGLMARTGEAEHLYDAPALLALEREVIGPQLRGFHAYIYPPFFAWVFVPLSLIPYELAFAIWSVLGLTGLFLALRMLGVNARRTMPWVLTFFPVFASVSFGQNSLLSITLFAGTYLLWKERRLVLAGLVLSLMLYKPQLVAGVLLLWALDWRRDRRALMGFAAGASALVAICFVALPEVSRSYIEFFRTVPELTSGSGAPLWHMHSVLNFFKMLMPGTGILPVLLAAAVGGVALIGFVRLRKSYRSEPAILFAVAILLTFCLTPYVLVYDWAILVVPAILLWRYRPADREFLSSAFAAIWLTTLVGGLFAKLQLDDLPFTLQPTVPALLIACYFMWRRLSTAPANEPSGRPFIGGPAHETA